MSIGAKPWESSGGAASVPDASETTKGKIRIATSTEASTGTNDTTAMTPLTVKERIDAALVGGVEYKGTFNANTGLTNSGGNLNNAEKGDLYIIDTLGTIYGQTWAVGDHLLINDNMGGSIDNSKIDKVDNTDAVTSVNGLSGPVVLNGGNVGADYSASNYTEANTNIDGHLEGIDDQFALTAPLASPALTGNPTAPTQSASDNSTKIATTFYVDRAVSAGGASDASETVKGIIEIATNTEAQAASANNKALVPSNIGHIDTGDLNDDGTYQPADPGLASIAALTTSANKMIYTDGSDSYATTDLTAFARSLLDDANATTARATLSLGSAALLDADNTANNVVKLDSNGKLPAIDGSQLTNLPSGATQLNDLSDVTITGAATGEVLRYSGSAWVDATLAYTDLSGTPTLGTAAASAATDFQPADPGLASIAALTTSANKMIYTDGSDSYATTDLTAFARSLLDDANATTARATLSLGSAALLDADNTANNVVKLDSNGKLPAIDGSQLTNLASASDASETVKGIIEIATNAEAQAASANDKALVPSNIGNIDTGDLNDDGTYLKDLSADSSPQLGGDLDLNSNDIVTTGNADLGLAPAGTGFVEIKGNTNPGAIRLNCESNSHGVQLQSPAHSANATYQLILPTGVGTAGQVLKTDGGDGTSEPTAQLSWVDQSGGGGGGVTYSAITADPANAQAGYHYSCTGTFTITLATSGYSAGDEIRVKNMGTGTITIDPQTTTIDGSTTDYTLDVQYSAITLVSTGTNWEVI